MKNYLKIAFAIIPISFLLFFTSCKNKNSIPVVHVTPSAINLNAVQGDVLTFGVTVISDVDNLTRVVITTQLENSILQVAFDSAITGKSFNYNYEYFVPDSITGWCLLPLPLTTIMVIWATFQPG